MIIAVAAAETISGTFASVNRRRGERERREPEAHEHLGVIIADQLFSQAFGHVRGPGVVFDLEDDFLARDRVAVLLDIELGARALLLAGRGLLAGHRQDHADGDGVVIRPAGAAKSAAPNAAANIEYLDIKGPPVRP